MPIVSLVVRLLALFSPEMLAFSDTFQNSERGDFVLAQYQKREHENTLP
jgi:hypothetical protein